MTLVGCSSSDNSPSASFEISVLTTELTLREGDPDGLNLAFEVTRNGNHSQPIDLDVRGRTVDDVRYLSSDLSDTQLTDTETGSIATLRMAISARPIALQQRELLIVATDGTRTKTQAVTVMVEPTLAPDVYLLIGQSNMVGFSGEGTRQSDPGQPDESVERIKQLNASKNAADIFSDPSSFTDAANNVVDPGIVIAADPLHVPEDASNDGGKDLSYIGLGLSFAKAALNDTSADIVLVPAAWSGSSFCRSGVDGPPGNWMAQPSDNPELGNTLLFDRALTRTNITLEATGGVLRGILWHQGESDSNDRCADVYQDNLITLVGQLRERLPRVSDREALRHQANLNVESDDTIMPVPFVLGTMSRGADDREDLSSYSDVKQVVDDAHRALPDLLTGVGLSLHDDLTPAEGYPCGNTSCIHFGAAALREMGARYYTAWLDALESGE